MPIRCKRLPDPSVIRSDITATSENQEIPDAKYLHSSGTTIFEAVSNIVMPKQNTSATCSSSAAKYGVNPLLLEGIGQTGPRSLRVVAPDAIPD